MIVGKYLWNGDDLSDAYKIRKEVFIKELGRAEEKVFDDLDKVSVHGVVYNEKQNPVASGRIFFDGEEYRLGKIAVLKEERKNGYGDFLVRMLIDKGFEAGADIINVRTQAPTVDFYKKIGFISNGEIFQDIDDLYVQAMQLKKNDLCKKCFT